MIVKCVKHYRNFRGEIIEGKLTLGKNYLVLGVNIEAPGEIWANLYDERDGGNRLTYMDCFEIVDSRVMPGYCFQVYENGLATLVPEEFERGFWERFYDGDPEAERIFADVVARLKKFHNFEVEEEAVEVEEDVW